MTENEDVDAFRELIEAAKNVVFFTGAGISTFRCSNSRMTGMCVTAILPTNNGSRSPPSSTYFMTARSPLR